MMLCTSAEVEEKTVVKESMLSVFHVGERGVGIGYRDTCWRGEGGCEYSNH